MDRLVRKATTALSVTIREPHGLCVAHSVKGGLWVVESPGATAVVCCANGGGLRLHRAKPTAEPHGNFRAAKAPPPPGAQRVSGGASRWAPSSCPRAACLQG
jgi:hypothetical protein